MKFYILVVFTFLICSKNNLFTNGFSVFTFVFISVHVRNGIIHYSKNGKIMYQYEFSTK